MTHLLTNSAYFSGVVSQCLRHDIYFFQKQEGTIYEIAEIHLPSSTKDSLSWRFSEYKNGVEHFDQTGDEQNMYEHPLPVWFQELLNIACHKEEKSA